MCGVLLVRVLLVDLDRPPPPPTGRLAAPLPGGARAEGVSGELLERDLLVDLDLEHLQVGGGAVPGVHPHVRGRPAEQESKMMVRIFISTTVIYMSTY